MCSVIVYKRTILCVTKWLLVGVVIGWVQKFDEELRNQPQFVDKLVLTGNKILTSCHPDAKREVGYHVRALTARWQQVSSLLSVICCSFVDDTMK